ncbi:MAG: hypothetical protein M3O62_02015 [Pseudomonadota bacterium]|nr:hypothetical protein [Pseudomonadota bacterium]
MLAPEITFGALLVVQALHLLHHRPAKRHISFAEVISAIVLCIPPTSAWVPAIVLMSAHGMLIAVQLIGSAWIRKLSPDWGVRL